MKCRPVVHARFTAVSWLIALVYRGMINDATLCCRLTKLKIFRMTVEPILIYGCDSWSLTQSVENTLDGTYTRMLQKTQNASWRHHMTNQELYGSFPQITTIVRQWRLRLAGHGMRHDEVLFWKPDGPRRRGRPKTTLQNIVEKYTNLSGTNLIEAMKNRNLWKEIFMSHMKWKT